MSNVRFFSAIALSALVTGTIVAGLTLARPAHADVPRTAVCQPFGAWNPEKVSAFMDTQLAAGRTGFVSAPNGVLCAW